MANETIELSEKQSVAFKILEDNITNELLFGGGAGGGKAQPLWAKVLTPNGWVDMGDLVVGENVITPNGNTSKIVGINNHLEKEIFEVVFIDGSKTYCCDEHLWYCWQARKKQRAKTKNTKDIIKLIEQGRNILIPLIDRFEYGTKYNSEYSPYLIGCLLGDGGIIKTVTLTTADQQLVDEITCELPSHIEIKQFNEYGYRLIQKNVIRKFDGSKRNLLLEHLKHLKIYGLRCEKKHIPEIFFYSDLQTRISIIQGLLDTDGTIDKRGHISFTSKSEQLCLGLQYLIRSVGGKATLNEKEKFCYYKGVKKTGTYYELYINSNDNNLFRLKRKLEKVKKYNGGVELGKRIKSIKPYSKENARCISIDSPEKLYITDDFTVTHNSMLGCVWHIHRRTTYPNSRGLIGRAKIANLEQSTLVTLFKVANLLGYKQNIHYRYNSQKHVINWINGSQTILKDLFLYPSDPDFISLGSTEYTDGFIDEATEISLKAFEIVSTRIRWNLDLYNLVPKLLLTANPSEGWVKERFVEVDTKPVLLAPHQKFVQSLITENPDEQFKQLYISQLERLSSDYDKQRLLYGDWGAIRDVTNPFATQWNDKKHISEAPIYDTKKQLIISVDFNLVPFCATFHHNFTDATGEHWHTFAEEEIKHGSIPAMIDLILLKYKLSLPNAILTGDAMGNRGDISQRDNASLYLQLLRGLGMHQRQLKVSNNPTHENSRSDCNYILYHYPDYKVHPTCTGIIRDARNVQVDAEGSIIKGNRKDTNQRADFIDAGLRYFVHNILYQWIDSHQKRNSFIKRS